MFLLRRIFPAADMHRAGFRRNDGDAGSYFTGGHRSLVLRSLHCGCRLVSLSEIVSSFTVNEDTAVSEITEAETFLVQLPEGAAETQRSFEHC